MTRCEQSKGTTESKRIGEVAQINPRMEKSAHPEDLEVSFVPMASVEAETGRINVSNTRRFSGVKKGYTSFREGDVLFAKITPCMENGKMAVVPKLVNDMGYGSTEFHVLRPRNSIDARYLYHFVASKHFRNKAAHNMTGAVGQKRVLASFIENSEIPVPPIEKQRAIVAEIEKQFSRLDEAAANLKSVKANLKRYKAAILKAAVEGRLVPPEAELARKEGRTYETGEQLLSRILQERRAAREKQNSDSRNKKYVEPRQLETTILPDLPEGWLWASFGQVGERVTVGHVGPMKNEYVDKGVPFLRSQNVRANRFNSEGLKFISLEFHHKLAKSALKPGDIVVVRSGSVGVSCVIPKNLIEANCSDLVIVKSPRAVLPSFGAYYMNSVVETRVASGKVGVALTHFNTQSVAEMPIPVPPLAEQNRIVTEADRHFSIVDELETQININLQRGERLRQTVLQQAFQSEPST